MDAELRPLEALLIRRRAEARQRLAALGEAMGGIRHSRLDSPADDEHDPEGPTMSAEWSRISGLQREARDEAAEFERALTRLRDGDYGTCSRCGSRIGAARLEARPATELCIDCARRAG